MSKYEGATILDKMKELYKKHSVRLDNMREWYDIQKIESRILSDLEDIINEYEIEVQQRIQEEDYNTTVDIYKELEAGVKSKKQEKLLQLYRRLVNQNLQVNLHILEKIKELENE